MYAALKEYDVRLPIHASVWAEVERPDQSRLRVQLSETEPGLYAGSFQTYLAGVYKCRLMAEGNSSKGLRFTREKTLTAGVYYGEGRPRGGNESVELMCRLLHCLFEEHEGLPSTSARRLAELGFDMKRFIECIEQVCPKLPTESIPGIRHKLTEVLLDRPQLASKLKLATAVPNRRIKPKAVVKPKKRTLVEKPEVPTMFMPLDLAIEEKRVAGKASKPMKRTLFEKPEVPTMFMPLNLATEEKRVAGKASKPKGKKKPPKHRG